MTSYRIDNSYLLLLRKYIELIDLTTDITTIFNDIKIYKFNRNNQFKIKGMQY